MQWGEGYIGPSFLPWLDRVTPVTKIRDPHKKNKGVTRTGLPIALAFGISVGKTQGMTSVEGLTVSFGRSAGRYKGCSEYIMMSRARCHGRGGLLIRHPFNYGRFCLRDDFTGGSIMNRARNYASRRRCLDREVERCKETLKRNQTVVECIMEKRGEVGGVHAKMEEVRVWHAQQRMLCGGDDLGTKGVYYMYMRRDDITLVARGGANGRQKSVVLSRSDKKVLYRVRPPTTAEARKESSRLLKEEEDIDYDFLPEFPLSILKKGILSCSFVAPHMRAPVCCALATPNLSTRTPSTKVCGYALIRCMNLGCWRGTGTLITMNSGAVTVLWLRIRSVGSCEGVTALRRWVPRSWT